MKRISGETVFQIISHIVLILVAFLVIMPFILLLMSSLTAENELVAHGYAFWPKVFSLEAYEYLVQGGTKEAKLPFNGDHKAFFDQITESVNLHVRNTRPFCR